MGQGLPFDAPEEAGTQALVGRREAPAHVAFAEGALGDSPCVARRGRIGKRTRFNNDCLYKHVKGLFPDSSLHALHSKTTRRLLSSPYIQGEAGPTLPAAASSSG